MMNTEDFLESENIFQHADEMLKGCLERLESENIFQHADEMLKGCLERKEGE